MITFEKREPEIKVNFPAFFKHISTNQTFLFFDKNHAVAVTEKNNGSAETIGSFIKAICSCLNSDIWVQVHGKLVIEA